MYQPPDENGYVPVLEKISRKTLAYGERTLMTEFRVGKGAVIPAHRHPHEQTGYLVSGHLRLTIGGGTCEVAPGGSWCIPGNMEHSATAMEECVAIEVFSPVREDYLP